MWLRLMRRPFIQSVHTPSAVQFAPTRSKVTMDDMLFTLPAQRVSYCATITLSCRHHFIHWLKLVLSINRLRYAATHCNSCYDHAVSFFCAGQLFSKSTAFGTRLHTATVATITLSPFLGGGLFFWVFLGVPPCP